MKTVENGQKVKVHYRGTFSDGEEFDNSYIRGQALEFKVGAGEMIHGFDSAVSGMTEGEKKTITLTPEMAYGDHRADAVQKVQKGAFPADFEFEVGEMVQGNTPNGPFVAKIAALEEDEVTLDLNHPLAGKELNFEIELLEIQS
jgi:FKBP-type peptidyl-prolyl cis-trans isomerase 2|tara:strand:- start:545 stop:976 length:432 start_codon:yes stop_codon:yes gene_type:complete